MLVDANLSYKQNGYYIAKSLLEPHIQILSNALYEMDTVIIEQLYSQGFSSGHGPSSELNIIHGHLKLLLNQNKEAYIASLKVCANLLSIHSLLMSQAILNMIKSFGVHLPVLQTTPVLHILGDDLKIPGGYYGIGVHQDWSSLQGSLDTIIIWIPFMQVDKNNFPVELIPGSHLGGLYPGKISEHLYETDPACYNEKDFIPAELSLGDVLFMSSFTLHKSSLIESNGFRIACSTRYENASESTYIKRLYPHSQKRIVTRELLHNDFPSPDQMKELFSH
jgi:ectoine hydroxylase-related dioxygenase (phytanoyl-CoA dioxygenase family)